MLCKSYEVLIKAQMAGSYRHEKCSPRGPDPQSRPMEVSSDIIHKFQFLNSFSWVRAWQPNKDRQKGSLIVEYRSVGVCQEGPPTEKPEQEQWSESYCSETNPSPRVPHLSFVSFSLRHPNRRGEADTLGQLTPEVTLPEAGLLGLCKFTTGLHYK